ncbi:uncharacterized protein LOC107036574 isoform X1 [Diachasma alloeum]|uniref:uncharacterized protein LOC107036574 isoform X1 n=1 Tax=Diachasma alloeum TaxID=454923 RepID=UPI00073841F4|nr:uncharacterized protein LOC107036574 isoform X1 [Diachasma alloeum]
MAPRCKIPGCCGETNRTVFQVPKDVDRRENWLKAIHQVFPNLHIDGKFHVCEKHFRKTDFNSCIVDKSGRIIQEDSLRTRKRLKLGVVPCVMDSQSPEVWVQTNTINDPFRSLTDSSGRDESELRPSSPVQDATITPVTRRCEIPKCSTGSHQPVFRLPSDPKTRERWLSAIRNAYPNLSLRKNIYICERHFKSTDFINNPADKTDNILQKDSAQTRRRLRLGVVPCFMDSQAPKIFSSGRDKSTTEVNHWIHCDCYFDETFNENHFGSACDMDRTERLKRRNSAATETKPVKRREGRKSTAGLQLEPIFVDCQDPIGAKIPKKESHVCPSDQIESRSLNQQEFQELPYDGKSSPGLTIKEELVGVPESSYDRGSSPGVMIKEEHVDVPESSYDGSSSPGVMIKEEHVDVPESSYDGSSSPGVMIKEEHVDVPEDKENYDF